MLKFTLMKNLYYELDPEKMEGVKEIHSGDAHYRILPLSFPELPDLYSMTAQESYQPYVTLYYLYVNSDRYPSDITESRIKKLLAVFYRHYFPQYYKEEALEQVERLLDKDSEGDISPEWNALDILECLDPDKMPGYQKKYAYKEIQTLEDIRNGKTGDEYKPKTAFPGMSFSRKYKPE